VFNFSLQLLSKTCIAATSDLASSAEHAFEESLNFEPIEIRDKKGSSNYL
jgi:hypothetical protein